jgi:lipopolysaccharide heptosyltransferase I
MFGFSSCRKSPSRQIPIPSRILIVRMSAIGDVIHGLPVLNTLRTRYPRAEIAWLVEDRAASLLQGHWALDRLIIARKGWMKSTEQIRLLRKRVQAFAPDVTIDLQGLFKSAFAAWLSGAPSRLGFRDRNGREGSRFLNNVTVRTSCRHVIDCNLELLQPLGIVGSSIHFDLPERESEKRVAQEILSQLAIPGPFAMINVGAGWNSKLWRAERYGEVAKYLGKRYHLPSVVVWFGEKERKMAETVVTASQWQARLAPPTSLNELASLARKARMFVGSDTGPLHLAAAVETPCIGLYGPMPAWRNGPYGFQHHAIQQMTLEGNSRERRNASRASMDAIDVPTVCRACDAVLEHSMGQKVPPTLGHFVMPEGGNVPA